MSNLKTSIFTTNLWQKVFIIFCPIKTCDLMQKEDDSVCNNGGSCKTESVCEEKDKCFCTIYVTCKAEEKSKASNNRVKFRSASNRQLKIKDDSESETILNTAAGTNTAKLILFKYNCCKIAAIFWCMIWAAQWVFKWTNLHLLLRTRSLSSWEGKFAETNSFYA